ncbi:helix-turn-helix transcriptional regulator [Streptomyces sp. NBC_00984]|uniref:helix-turn-helix domain-containing protein n=1 Tax=Streptomyces sp. NBC_00984 TaxID=2903700 RepID=UPI00386D3802|nr:helix-turn-helix transcriptional regulator [Streptomyces sp. NBC_00984]
MTQDAPKRHTPETFAAWLREMMTRLGYPDRGQKKFAQDAGLSAATVSRLLRADGTPETDTLETLAVALRVGLPELLIRAGVVREEDLANLRPINPKPITSREAAAELGITSPEGIDAFERMVNGLRAVETDERSANG